MSKLAVCYQGGFLAQDTVQQKFTGTGKLFQTLQMIAYIGLCFLKDQATLFGISPSGSQEEKDCWLHPEKLSFV